MTLSILQRISIGTLLKIIILSLLALMTAVYLPLNVISVSDVVEDAESDRLLRLHENAQNQLYSQGKEATALATMLANIDSLNIAFANGDRQTLTRELVPVFEVLKRDYGVRQFQYHTPPAISFLRVHKPEKFGDDLSSFRQTVVETNRTKKPVTGLEKGVAGLGIRGIAPIIHNGKHLGSVELGMSFGQTFFKQFQQNNAAEIGLYLRETNGFSLFASSFEQAQIFTDTELQQSMTQQQFKGVEFNSKPYQFLAKSISDYSGQPIGVLVVGVDHSEYAAQQSASIQISLGVGIVALLIGLLLATLASRNIANPIARTARAMREIAQGEGDLTQRLDDSASNELGELATAFNLFAEKVRGIVSQISAETRSLADSSDHLARLVMQAQQGVDRQQNETTQVATAMHQNVASLSEVAGQAQLGNQSAEQAGKMSESGQRVVVSTVQSIESLSGGIDQAAAVINQLAEDSSAIGSVLDVIKSIAEQTNLLALNAAIEAARAGEQGRGFAVVADEVRTLASRTQQSTSEIQSTIEQLQLRAKSAVDVMQTSRASASKSVELVQQASAGLQQIGDAVTDIKGMNMQIASAVEQQTKVADEINRSITNINDIGVNLSDTAEQTADSAKQVASLAQRLRQLVSAFKT